MAERYQGRFSPGNDKGSGLEPADGRRVDAAGFRSNLMFVPPVLVVLAHLGAGPERLVTSIAAGGTLTLGAWLLREGLRAEAAYHNRKVARRPTFPRKIFAAALAGIGIGLAASASGVEVFGASLYGLATAVLHLAAFGFDAEDEAGADETAVDLHAAGAAVTRAAAFLGTRQAQPVTQYIQQGFVRKAQKLRAIAIDCCFYMQGFHFFPPARA